MSNITERRKVKENEVTKLSGCPFDRLLKKLHPQQIP